MYLSLVSFLLFAMSLCYLLCRLKRGQASKEKKKELVGCTAWRLPLCLDSTSSSKRRTKEEAEAETGSCWLQ